MALTDCRVVSDSSVSFGQFFGELVDGSVCWSWANWAARSVVAHGGAGVSGDARSLFVFVHNLDNGSWEILSGILIVCTQASIEPDDSPEESRCKRMRDRKCVIDKPART
jgi:hypothetical protein